MQSYLVSLEGRNLIIESFEKKPGDRFGFFATRLVMAESEQSAGQIAIDLVRSELAATTLRNEGVSTGAEFLVEGVRKQESFSQGSVLGGFTFYAEEEIGDQFE